MPGDVFQIILWYILKNPVCVSVTYYNFPKNNYSKATFVLGIATSLVYMQKAFDLHALNRIANATGQAGWIIN